MSAPATRHVGISLGQLANFNDGLGEFCRRLGSGLVQRAPALRRDHGIQLWFHMNPDLAGHFGEQVNYLPAAKSQRGSHRLATRFDIWHALHQLSRLAPPEGARHRLVTVHDLNFLYFKNLFSQMRDMHRMRKLLKRTDHIVAITDYVRQDVVRHMHWAGPIDVVHNGVTDLSGHDQAPVDLPCGPGGYLFHISRMAPSKNMPSIVDLAAHWPQQHFVLAGPRTSDSLAVARRVQRRGLKNVTMVYHVSEAQKSWLFAHCAGLLFPSLCEGFGLPVVEAMYFGKPVFLSRLTALPEVGGAAAHYFDSFDPAAMRQTVEAGLARHAQPGARDAVVHWARQFNWERCADRYVDLYLRLLAGSP